MTVLGEVALPHALDFAGTPVGGLSSLAYDTERGLYYALCDDRSERAPARFYALDIDLADGTLDEGDVRVVAATTLLGPDGAPYPPRSVDPEGLALIGPSRLVVSSEGEAKAGVHPFLSELTLDGRFVRALALPHAVLPVVGGGVGVRDNLAFEGVTVTPAGTLLTMTENALVQDGPAAAAGQPSPSRLLRYDLASGELIGQYLYWTEPLRRGPDPPEAFADTGVVELLALDEDRFLVLERGYATGVGIDLRLFLADLRGATEIGARAALAGDADGIRSVAKRLLLDLADLGVALDNFEGLAFGPPLADGRRTLLLVADNNFSPSQRSLILALALAPGLLADGAGEEAAWIVARPVGVGPNGAPTGRQ